VVGVSGVSEVKVELNDSGIRELLNSSGVQGFLRGKAEIARASAAAGGGTYEVEVTPGKVRARAKIRTVDREAREASSERSTLAKAGYLTGGTPGRG
jgi:hypothetical protein